MGPGSVAASAASTLPQKRDSSCVFMPMLDRINSLEDRRNAYASSTINRRIDRCREEGAPGHHAHVLAMSIASLKIDAQGARKTGPQDGPHIGMRRAPVRLA